MTNLCIDSKTCSGCSACMNVCPKDAIKMEQDDEGFLIPHINKDKCIECSRCTLVCPNNNNNKRNEYCKHAYAFQNNDLKTLKKSSSGGFFPAIAKYIIENNGYVCGCVLDEKLMPIHLVTNRWEDIERMQDSKYVQSDLGDCFNDIIRLIRDGKVVLFTGSSCQVAGIKNVVEINGLDCSKLVTIDFFCHGVPTPLIWKEYLAFYEKTNNTEIESFRWRNKKYGWGKKSRGTYHLNTVILKNGKRDDVSLLGRMWYAIFFSNLCLRNYCYDCPYSSINKPAEFTMADFWGVEDIIRDFSDGKGCSLVITHTKYAEDFIQGLNDKARIVEIDVDVAIKRQGNAFCPSKRPDGRAAFWDDYNKYGFGFVTKKYFRYDYFHRIKDLLHRVLFELRLTNLYK